MKKGTFKALLTALCNKKQENLISSGTKKKTQGTISEKKYGFFFLINLLHEAEDYQLPAEQNFVFLVINITI